MPHLMVAMDECESLRPTVGMGSYNIDIREVQRTWPYMPEYDRTQVLAL